MTISDARPDAAASATSAGSLLGQSRLRKEDPELLTGEARFVDDLVIQGALHMTAVRSPHARARINSVDLDGARQQPGVRHVFAGADLAGLWAAPMPCAWVVTDDMKSPEHFPVAVGQANYVGDIVAIVLADSKAAAVDAAESVIVDYEPLDAAVDLEDAASDRVVIHDGLGTNASYTWELKPDEAAVDAAFAAADVTVSQRYVQQRLIPSAMEPRGVVAIPAPHGGELTVYSSTQIPHILKLMLSVTTGTPEHKVRVIAPAVGGGFGSKLDVYAEEVLAAALARKTGQPVRWTETRSEASQSTIQGRGQIQHIELAADSEGKVSAVRVDLLADMGAYLQLVTPGVPLLGAFLYHGVYDIPAYSFSCTGVFTNKTPTDAYRGAGRPEASYAIERAMDALARQVGISPEEVRRRNFIPNDAFPYASAPGLEFDSGDYDTNLTAALELAGYDDLRAEQERRRADGDPTMLGIGLCTYVEMCGLAPSRTLGALNFGAGGWESATVRILPSGVVQVITGTAPHGQGHETSWSMIVADRLGIDPDLVEVLHSDTAIAPLGLDTYGSRSLAVGGTALWHATEKVLDKARRIAAHLMEADEHDIEVVDGTFRVRGTPSREVALVDVAGAAFVAHNLPDGMEPNLEAQVSWDPPNFTFPFGTHVAVVEVDSETGRIHIRDYIAVDDCGNQVNPLIVEGQLHGGILQGIAQALWEEAVFDETGQPRTSNFGDYMIPSAMEAPRYTLGSTTTPSPVNPMGVKGVGEAGTIGSAAAMMSAVCDALAPYGITDIDMPASPRKVWQAIQDKEGAR